MLRGALATGTLLTPNDGVQSLTFTLAGRGGATLGSPAVNTMTISAAVVNRTRLLCRHAATPSAVAR